MRTLTFIVVPAFLFLASATIGTHGFVEDQSNITSSNVSATTEIPDVTSLSTTDFWLGNATAVSSNMTESIVLASSSTASAASAATSTSAAATAATTLASCPFNPCFNDGDCFLQGSGYVCVCPYPFGGRVCDKDATTTTAAPTTTTTPTPTLPPCPFNPCINNGSCYLTANSYTCVCPSAFAGLVCEDLAMTTTTTQVSGPCAFSPCLNGGSCRVVGGVDFLCDCPSSFTGAFCHSHDAPTTAGTAHTPCSNNPCLNGGTCLVQNGTLKCLCPPGKTGKYCLNTCYSVSKQSFCKSAADIVFVIEAAKGDSHCDIDHEGDFIKNLVDSCGVDQNDFIRFSVVVYSDSVVEVIALDQYKNNPRAFKARITELTGSCSFASAPAEIPQGSGQSDLAHALDFVRETSLANARYSVPRVVVPIMHQMPTGEKAWRLNDIVSAGQALKDDCVSVLGIGISGPTLDLDTAHKTVSQPYADHLWVWPTFNRLEIASTIG